MMGDESRALSAYEDKLASIFGDARSMVSGLKADKVRAEAALERERAARMAGEARAASAAASTALHHEAEIEAIQAELEAAVDQAVREEGEAAQREMDDATKSFEDELAELRRAHAESLGQVSE